MKLNALFTQFKGRQKHTKIPERKEDSRLDKDSVAEIIQM